MSTTSGPKVVSDGLVLNIDPANVRCYPGSGTAVTDLSQNKWPATLTNGLVYASANNGGFVHDGVNDYLDIGVHGVSSAASVISNFTIESWFKITAFQPTPYFGLQNQFLVKGPASTYNYAAQVNSDTIVAFYKRTTPEGLQPHTFAVSSLQNNVTQIVFVITSNTDVACYQNGVFVGTQPVLGTAIASSAVDHLDISGNLDASTAFEGTIYNTRIYDKVLTAAEITQNFEALRGRFGI